VGKRESIRGRARERDRHTQPEQDDTAGVMGDDESPYHAHMQPSDTSARVQGIVDAAERAAQQLRGQAEERAAERIAEADRAGANRVSAAEEEAEEILAQARAQAETIVKTAGEESGKILADAREQGERQLTVQRAEAQEQANELRAEARAEAREIVGEAHEIAREVLHDGSEVSRNLSDLSVSLRNNAERLLRDVRLTHGSMTARLDQAASGGASAGERTRGEGLPRSRRSTRDELDTELEVPEFIPRG
jgi:F0F1-type ATP synthase membrane subunit b/b'